MSCSRMLNDYDGIQHDYTKKQRLVWERVFLPPMAPPEWADRETLWNAVEANEKTKDSRLAREFIVALPVELNRDAWIELLTDFIQTQFVDDGMCADVSIHDTDGHNPHAHILLTVRPLNENGTWQYKTEKDYLCMKDGAERGFTAAEYKDAQRDGWEKQYPYWISQKKKEYMTPSEAEAKGLERASKYAKSTKFGRQNPISARWNSDEQLVAWRKAWADAVNLCLERYGHDERIDHRSHADRGLDEQPTIHEGVEAKAMEVKGFISERCELNRQIRADNALLRRLKERITELAEHTVEAVAEKLERIRGRIIFLRYGVLHIGRVRKEAVDYLTEAKPLYGRYRTIRRTIRSKVKQRHRLQKELDATSILNIPKQRDLSAKLAALTEDIEELRTEENAVMHRFDKSDADGMKQVPKEITGTEENVDRMDAQTERMTAEIQKREQEYHELIAQATELYSQELETARQVIRPQMDAETKQNIIAATKEAQLSVLELMNAVQGTDRNLDNDRHHPLDRIHLQER